MAIAADIRYQLCRRVLSADEEDRVPHPHQDNPELSLRATDISSQVSQCTVARDDVDILGGKLWMLFQHCLDWWLQRECRISGCIRIAEEVAFFGIKPTINGGRCPRRRLSYTRIDY